MEQKKLLQTIISITENRLMKKKPTQSPDIPFSSKFGMNNKNTRIKSYPPTSCLKYKEIF